MVSGTLRRKVLVLNEQPSIRNLLFLLKRFELENGCAAASNSSVGSLDQKQFDAVVLDLRLPRQWSANEVRGIRNVRAGWREKFLVIVAEINGPGTLDLIERCLFEGLPQSLVWPICN